MVATPVSASETHVHKNPHSGFSSASRGTNAWNASTRVGVKATGYSNHFKNTQNLGQKVNNLFENNELRELKTRQGFAGLQYVG